MPKNILYLCGGRNFHSKNPGRKIEGVISCWRDLGYKVDHICGADLLNSNVVNNTANYGAQMYHDKWYRRNLFTQMLVHSASEYKDMQHDKKIFQYIKTITSEKKRPQLIWERSSRLHKAGLDLAKELRIPYVLEWKDHLIPYSTSFFKKSALDVESYKNTESNYIVVESDVIKSNLAEKGIDPSKIYVALNAINPNEFNISSNARDEVRKKYNILKEQILIGYLGSYAFYHDTKRLVLAIKILSTTFPNDFKVLMVGNGKEYNETRKLAMDLGLLNNFIYMLDAVDKNQVPNILSALDIAVLPGSTDIICPIKVQEYMYMGLPSVIPDYKCNKEIIETGYDGMLFKPYDEESLANSLRFLIYNNEDRKKIGMRANVKASDKFTWLNTWGSVLSKIENDILIKE